MKNGRLTKLAAFAAVLAILTTLAVAPATAAAQVAGPPAAFSDIDGHWARFEIELLASKGVVEALGAESFAPDVPINRADLAKMLVIGLDHKDEVSALSQEPSTFNDVATDDPDRAYIEVAYELGIVNGYPDGTFRPDAEISRAEMTAMILRALEWEELAQTTPVTKGVYPDQSSIGDWALGYAILAQKTGIIKGYPDGTFRPLDQTTRSQAAVLVARMLATMGRLYDLSGVVQTVELIDGALNIDTPTGTRRIVVHGDTRVYRNGLPATLGDLGFFDEVMVSLDSTGRPTFVAAYLTTVKGDLTAVSAAGGTIAMNGATLAVRPDASIYRHGHQVPLSSLKPGDRAVAVLRTIDGSGAVRAVDAVNVMASGALVTYDVTHKTLVVDVRAAGATERRSYAVLPTTAVFIDGKRAGLIDLKPGDVLELAADQPDGPLTFVSAERP
ncbi:MAG: S-layer homology domain-containing protein [Bacillota bacterium]